MSVYLNVCMSEYYVKMVTFYMLYVCLYTCMYIYMSVRYVIHLFIYIYLFQVSIVVTDWWLSDW